MVSSMAISQDPKFTEDYKSDLRQPTPDSEALISSDDECNHLDSPQQVKNRQKPVSRVKQLNEAAPVASLTRKDSITSSSMSPTTSHPSTPPSDVGVWAHQTQGNSNVGRGHSGMSSFPWSSGIWNIEPRKEPPSRLSEVRSSPSSIGSSLTPSNGLYSETNTIQKDQLTNPTIPFPIPLHPTPKTYRSQSYSVGQLDQDSSASLMTNFSFGSKNRGRSIQNSGLQHKPSRPSMLSEMTNEGILGRLKEINDHDNNISRNRMNDVSSCEAKNVKTHTHDNGSSLQQSLTSSILPASSISNTILYNSHGAFPEEFDSAIDELDDLHESLHEGHLKILSGRRPSGAGSLNNSRVANCGFVENRKLENVKKASWQSSLGFGGLGDVSQSRRHSFADIPTSHHAAERITKTTFGKEKIVQEKPSPQEYSSDYQEQTPGSFIEQTASYFDRISAPSRKSGSYGTAPLLTPSHPHAVQTLYGGIRSSSTYNVIYNSNQPRQSNSFIIVLFKCSRSEIFYIQEGTGLAVKSGDLVIVEADRGTDLGTVARANVDWATAKELHEYYTEEHYKWLTMYSQVVSRSLEVKAVCSSTLSNGFQGSPGGVLGNSILQESNQSDIKPKIIKRLAQKHEIQALREKEGSEAKAKRICMQKVKEHGLSMEILDAEFQMDWKKLTFYYFADVYINFNSLVTDLFKIYKTRIWMSAINPASFACSSLSLKAPHFTDSAVLNGSVVKKTEWHRPMFEPQKLSCALQATRELPNMYSQQLNIPVERSFNSFLTPSFASGLPAYIGSNPRNASVFPNVFVPNDPLIGFTAQTDFRRQKMRFPVQNITLPVYQDSDYRQRSTCNPDEAWAKSLQKLSIDNR
ncbi:hypothetical protein Golomagni_02316 [Golovinomyces magnicellulatus]|nr:hypothetical protein Golomagni_02316 [Golovinomyces magnicellulatus]